MTAYSSLQGSAPLIALESDPFDLFSQWMEEARRTEPCDPNAMTVATATPEGRPSARILLLKEFDRRGFVFYTNNQSRKGNELAHNPQVALLFYWKSLGRQIRIEGPTEPVSAEEADAYFASRTWLSRIGAVASEQSRPLADRAIFENRIKDVSRHFPEHDPHNGAKEGLVPRPPYWSGHRVRPLRMEFWQERPYRLHDRVVWMMPDDQGDQWNSTRLYP